MQASQVEQCLTETILAWFPAQMYQLRTEADETSMVREALGLEEKSFRTHLCRYARK